MGSIEETAHNFEINGLHAYHGTKTLPHQECFLPTKTAQCHASNLIVLKNGDLLCAWFGGSQEGKKDICISLSRLPKGATTWTPAQQVTWDPLRSEQNPVLFERPDGEGIWLLYTSQNAGDQDSAHIKRIISTNGGHNWSEPAVLFPEPGTFIRQLVTVLDDGTWVIPTFKCRAEPGTRWVGEDDISCVRYSHDQGASWQEKEVPGSIGAVHMSIRRLSDGCYLALFRSRWADNIYLATSPNAIDWSEPRKTTLPNPNSGICFTVLPSGNLLCVYNHSSRADAEGRRTGLYDDIAEEGDTRQNQASKHGKEAFWGAPRAPLCLARSSDRGETWERRVLEEGSGYCMTNNSEQKLNRELSYPSIAVDEEGNIHVAFTFWRQGIKYVRLREEDLTK